MKAMKMINSTTTRGLLANFYRNKLFPTAAAASQKLTFSTTGAGNQPENQKKTLVGGDEDPEIRMSPFLRMIDLVKPAVNLVKDLRHLLVFKVDYPGAVEVRLNTELFPSLKKLLKKSPVRAVPGNEGTTYFIPIPGISVEEGDQLKPIVFRNQLGVFASRHHAKVGGGIGYQYWVPLPKGFTMDDLTIAHANGQMSVLVPNQKKEELVSKQEEGQLVQEFAACMD